LQKLNRRLRHFGQRGLRPSGLNLVCKGKISGRENPKHSWRPPRGNVFHLGFVLSDFVALAVHLNQKIAAVLASSLLVFGTEVCLPAAENHVNVARFNQLRRDVLRVLRVSRPCVKAGWRSVGNRGVGNQPRCSPMIASQIEQIHQRLP
jgi:hypothetical protein